jgi:CheY-like chemotaxis protein
MSPGLDRQRLITGQGGIVLLVEDDPDIRLAMSELLEDEGYECVVATQGFEALDVLRRRIPSLIIVDLLMPVMNGVEFLTQLRQDPRYRNIPVFIMTAANERIVGVKLETLGARVVHKPVDVDMMKRLLAEYCPIAPSGSGSP